MSTKIKTIQASEILDSRGNPTLCVGVHLASGEIGLASVPSGSSKGSHEALELRDGNKPYQGKGVLKACQNVNRTIAKALQGKDAAQQEKIDDCLIRLDGTKNKSKLGANAILGVSLACARAVAREKKILLYQYLNKMFSSSPVSLPIPMFNVINGGKHADSGLDIQEFMIVPIGLKKFKERVRAGAEIFHLLKEVLSVGDFTTTVGDEGGFAPRLENHSQALEMILRAVEKSDYSLGKDVVLALDAAASEFYNKKENRYILRSEEASLSRERLIALYNEWIEQYSIISLEDGLEQNDWLGWAEMTEKLGRNVQIVGDDFLVTNPKRLRRAIKEKSANAILIKLNQIGTLTETLECVRCAQEAGWKVIISHRSGETCDTFIADLAVAVGADYIKAGSLSRGERVSKYNRLMKIEEELSK
ncbi:MAG TPA: phosphopyruvate hydratase [Candidatus Portnoybacteria bacterium]|nr:phosphopyruvate hydratase [Candidatus Portnoybacteria bacterium]